MKSIQELFKKTNLTPFSSLILLVVLTTLIIYVFKDQLSQTTTPARLLEIELNTLTPQSRTLFISFVSKLSDIEQILKSDQVSSSQKKRLTPLLAEMFNDINQAVKLDPSNYRLWLIRCQQYKRFNQYVKNSLTLAEESCKKCLELKPKDFAASMDLGGVYIVGGQYDKAIQVFENLSIEYPNNKNVYFNLGYAYNKNGANNKAIASLTKALELTTDVEEKKQIQTQINALLNTH